MPTLADLAAFGSNVGTGATLGTSKYLAALGLMGTRALTGGAPLSMAEAIELAKLHQQQANQESPRAAFAGDVVGSGLNSLAMGPSGIAGTIGRTALAGGVRGFTENEDLGEAGLGAALGGGLGAGAGLLGAGAKKVVAGTARALLNRTAAATKAGIKSEIQVANNNLNTLRSAFKPAELQAANKALNEKQALLLNLKDQLANATESADKRALTAQIRNVTNDVKSISAEVDYHRGARDAIRSAQMELGGARGRLTQLNKGTEIVKSGTDEDVLRLATPKMYGESVLRPNVGGSALMNPNNAASQLAPLGGGLAGYLAAKATDGDPTLWALAGATGGAGLGRIGLPRATALGAGLLRVGDKTGVTPEAAARVATNVMARPASRASLTGQPIDQADDLFNRGSDINRADDLFNAGKDSE